MYGTARIQRNKKYKLKKKIYITSNLVLKYVKKPVVSL